MFVVALGAAQAAPSADLERTARQLEAALVAPCCWSQQVSVHQSPAAEEVRRDLRRRLARGETREQILDDYVVQFGERILAEPRAEGYKRLLHVFPPAALLLSAAGVALLLRRATRPAVPPPPTAALAEPGEGYGDRLDDELREMD
jgi:cytochrome c-type biogenesis protein CcmH